MTYQSGLVLCKGVDLSVVSLLHTADSSITEHMCWSVLCWMQSLTAVVVDKFTSLSSFIAFEHP
jgi:hypothetical protein